MYGLAAEGDMLLAVALYKELMHSSLQEAVEKQRKIISMLGAAKPLTNNILVK